MKKSKEKCEVDIMRERMINLLFSLDEQRTRELLDVFATGLVIAEASKHFDNSKGLMS